MRNSLDAVITSVSSSVSTCSKRLSRATWARKPMAAATAGSEKRTSGRSCKAGNCDRLGAGNSGTGGATRPALSSTTPKPAFTSCPCCPCCDGRGGCGGCAAGRHGTFQHLAARQPGRCLRTDTEFGATHPQHALRRADPKPRLPGSCRARLHLDLALPQHHARAHHASARHAVGFFNLQAAGRTQAQHGAVHQPHRDVAFAGAQLAALGHRLTGHQRCLTGLASGACELRLGVMPLITEGD